MDAVYKFSDEEYIKAARVVHGSTGEIEVDADATVSRGSDRGVYVQAWVWVSDASAAFIADSAQDD